MPLQRDLFGFFAVGFAVGIVGGLVGCQPAGKQPAEKMTELTIPVSVVVALPDQAPLPIPSCAICASPVAEIRRWLRQAERDYEEVQRRLKGEIQRLENEESDAESNLDLERGKLAQEYNEAVPKEDDPQYQSRNRLEGLANARDAKSRLDRWYRQAKQVRIAPLEDNLEQVQGALKAAHSRLESLRASYADTLYAALPATPKRRWTTDDKGQAQMSIPRNEDWYVWGDATRVVATTLETEGRIDPTTGNFRATQREGGFVQSTYRWLVVVPRELDSSGKLSLTGANLYDLRSNPSRLQDSKDDAEVVRPVRK